MLSTDAIRDAEGDWWLDHIGNMAEHYIRLYERHELRSRYVLAAMGLGLAGARFAIDPSSINLDTIEKIFVTLFMVSVFIVGLILLGVMTPLRGSRFFAGSFVDSVHRLATSSDKKLALIKRLLFWSELADLAPYALSKEFQTVAEKFGLRSKEAGDVLAKYLLGEFRTDLSWWIAEHEGSDSADRIFDVRRRQVFWYWANKEASNRKAVLLQSAMSILTIPSLLLLFLIVVFAFI